MKKTALTLALLLMAFVAGAQTIKVDFHKGEVRKYSSKIDMTIGVPMQGEQKGSVSCNTTYNVTEATPEGYVVELKTDTFETSGEASIIQQFANSEIYGAMKTAPAKLKLDKNGAIVDLLNSDEVLASASKLAIDMINELYTKNPEIEKAMPKSRALMNVNEQMTKENALKFFRENTIFGLNGKDLKANPEAEEDFYNNLKVKSTYSVSDDNGQLGISKTSVCNMDDDAIKKFMKEQIGKMQGGEVSDANFNQIWSQMKMMGMTRITINGNANSTYGNGGWLNSNKSETNMKAMGASIKINYDETLL